MLFIFVFISFEFFQHPILYNLKFTILTDTRYLFLFIYAYHIKTHWRGREKYFFFILYSPLYIYVGSAKKYAFIKHQTKSLGKDIIQTQVLFTGNNQNVKGRAWGTARLANKLKVNKPKRLQSIRFFAKETLKTHSTLSHNHSNTHIYSNACLYALKKFIFCFKRETYLNLKFSLYIFLNSIIH